NTRISAIFGFPPQTGYFGLPKGLGDLGGSSGGGIAGQMVAGCAGLPMVFSYSDLRLPTNHDMCRSRWWAYH
ncbi:hypothetical protein ACVGWN_00145, partial [Enterobacter hormaechei]